MILNAEARLIHAEPILAAGLEGIREKPGYGCSRKHSLNVQNAVPSLAARAINSKTNFRGAEFERVVIAGGCLDFDIERSAPARDTKVVAEVVVGRVRRITVKTVPRNPHFVSHHLAELLPKHPKCINLTGEADQSQVLFRR